MTDNPTPPTPPNSPEPEPSTPPAPGGPGEATEPPYVPGPTEREAHAKMVQELVPAASRRISTIIRSVVTTCLAGDYAIMLPLFALHTGLHELVLDRDADGKPLAPGDALENEGKLYMLAAIIFSRYADKLRIRAVDALDKSMAGPGGPPPDDIAWTDADLDDCYTAALAEVNRFTGKP